MAKVKCMRCCKEMTFFKSVRQKIIFNSAFSDLPSIPVSKVFCDCCLFELQRQIIYSVVDFLNESRAISQAKLQESNKA